MVWAIIDAIVLLILVPVRHCSKGQGGLEAAVHCRVTEYMKFVTITGLFVMLNSPIEPLRSHNGRISVKNVTVTIFRDICP